MPIIQWIMVYMDVVTKVVSACADNNEFYGAGADTLSQVGMATQMQTSPTRIGGSPPKSSAQHSAPLGDSVALTKRLQVIADSSSYINGMLCLWA